VDYDRYGLSLNPYEYMEFEIAEIDKFEEIHPALDTLRLDDFLRAAIKKRVLARVVITGTSGSGRTVLARYIMARYNLLFIQVEGPIGIAYHERKHDGNVDRRQVGREVLSGLADEVRELNASFRDGPVKDLRDQLKALSGDYSIQNLRSLARDFTAGIHDLHGSFASLIENIPNAEIFSGLYSIFEKSQGLLIGTVVSEKREEILGGMKREEIGLEIALDSLHEERACLLAHQRWNKCKATPPLPFDSEGLQRVFHERPRTVGKSLKTLAFMLDAKLANYGGEGRHPEDKTLRFDEKQIRSNFLQFDKGVR
jgi:hypothetical protein